MTAGQKSEVGLPAANRYSDAAREFGRVKMQGALPPWVPYIVYTIIAVAAIAIVLAAAWPRRK